MIETNFRPAAITALILLASSAVSPAFAQNSPLVAPGARVEIDHAAIEAEPATVPPNAFGHFTCAYNELHTRLERKDCGGTHYSYEY